ncbi:MAG TPA: hypothetical protein VJ872_00580, partial [Nocardioides sp.]|nr:hypothetical protein [Nocardioides sp.]
MGSPFEDFKDLYGSSPQSIIEAAHAPGVHAEQLRQLGTDLLQDSRKSDAATIGDLKQISQTAKDAAGHAEKLAASGQLASGCLLKFGSDGSTFDSNVAALNARVLNAAYGAQHDPDVKSGKIKIDVAQMRADLTVQLRPTYNGYVRDLDHQASEVAGILKAGPDNLDNIKKLIREGFIPLTAATDWPGLKLTTDDKQAYYRSLFSRMTTEEQIAWVNQNKDKLPPEAAPGLSPEVQQHFADEVAGAIKAKGTVNADTVRLMAFFQSQQAYAHELFSQVSPRDIAGEVEDFNNNLFPRNPDGLTSPDKGQLDLYKSFLTAAGNTLATYSNATGQYAPPGGPSALADQWFKAITDDSHQQDSAALTLLIRAGGQQSTYDTGFLGDLTGKTYEWEIKHDGAVWSPRDTDVTYNPWDPPHVTATGDYTYGWTGGMKATDGLANLLGGMAHSPEAAQSFFLGHYPGSTQDLNHRMDYLIGGGDQRTWDGADNSDDGDGLGLALQAATVGQDTRTADGTLIADKLFTNIAKYGGHADSTFDDKWHVGPNMTDSLGTIAAGYTGDLYDMLSNTPPDAGATHLHISQSELTRVLGEIGGSDSHTGLETLTTAMLLETRN